MWGVPSVRTRFGAKQERSGSRGRGGYDVVQMVFLLGARRWRRFSRSVLEGESCVSSLLNLSPSCFFAAMDAIGRTLVVLGAGIGGLTAAIHLRRGLSFIHKVVLVDREDQFRFQGSFPWVATGNRSRDQISRPYSSLTQSGIQFVHGDVLHVDAPNKVVTISNGIVIRGDYIVIALGAEMRPELIPGLKEAGCNCYSLDGAEALSEARKIESGRVAILITGLPYRCPAAPLEVAMLLEHEFEELQVRDKIRIDVYTPEAGPMPVAGEAVSHQVLQMVESRGIHYHPSHIVSRVDPEKKQLTFTTGDSALFDLLIYVPPHRLPESLEHSGLALCNGWVSVDPATLETSVPGVFAVGDANVIMLKCGKPLPKAATFARAEAAVAAARIIRSITGHGAEERFTGHGFCLFEVGKGLAGKGHGNFFADPAPDIQLEHPSVASHEEKVDYEQFWISHFVSRM